MEKYQVDSNGFYGDFGGAYIPEILHRCVTELKEAYLNVLDSDEFKQEFSNLLRDYVGRPSPLYLARRLSEKYGCKIYLKREDLNHTGAHKINNAIGQALLARHMGKKRIIAETGAGQHGVATATVCALMNMECVVYMGETDIKRQHINVEKMKMRSTSGHIGKQDPEGCHQRSHTRLVLPSRRHILHNRLYRRPSPVSRHGGTPPVGD